jgi:imidazolonepropionase-like amidohydrolase
MIKSLKLSSLAKHGRCNTTHCYTMSNAYQSDNNSRYISRSQNDNPANTDISVRRVRQTIDEYLTNKKLRNTDPIGPTTIGRSPSQFISNPVSMSRFILLTIIAGLMSALWPVTAEAQIPAPRQSQPVALTGGTIHTLAGDVIENGIILFENGVITAVGADLALPAGTLVEDVSGHHVYPGLIDGWSHLGIFEIGAVDMTVDINEQGPINPNVMVERAFHPASRHIGVARSAGILTAVTSPGGGLISGQSAAMALEGWAWDDMTVRSGVGMIVNWPNPNNARTYPTQIEQLRDAFADARAYMTARQAAGVSQVPRHDFDSRWEAMIPVFQGERPVVVNANDVRQIQDAITWASEEQVRLVILGGRDAHLVVAHLRESNTPVLITTVLSSPSRWWEPYYAWYELPRQMHEAGVQFAIVGTSSAANANRLPFEAGTAAAFGLPIDEALKSLTVYPAQILGLDDRLGTLEPGKDASLIITTGNPVEYSTQVIQAWVRGRKSDMNDAHKQFYETYSEKVRQYQAQGE